MNIDKLTASIKKHEGCKLQAYRDTSGTGTWTIGYGRNLQNLNITQAQAEEWLRADLLEAEAEAQRFEEYARLDTPARQNAFIEMVFNLGAPTLRTFRAMLAAIRAGDWQHASLEALHSSWANQVGRRAAELAEMLRTGQFPTP